MMNEKYMEYLVYVKEYLTRNHGIDSPNPDIRSVPVFSIPFGCCTGVSV